MTDPSELEQVWNFVFLHKVAFLTATGSIATFGFLAGRYALDREISILKQRIELVQTQLGKALADLDQSKRDLLSRHDQLDLSGIKIRKQESDRAASFRFFVAAAALFAAVFSSAGLFLMNEANVKQNQWFAEQQGHEKQLDERLQHIQTLVTVKATSVSVHSPTKSKAPGSTLKVEHKELSQNPGAELH